MGLRVESRAKTEGPLVVAQRRTGEFDLAPRSCSIPVDFFGRLRVERDGSASASAGSKTKTDGT